MPAIQKAEPAAVMGKRKRNILLSALLLLCLSQFNALPTYAHNVNGFASIPLQQDIYTPSTDLFSGSFQYNIPIETPPGRNGINPNLTINYDNGGVATWVGSGWNLSVWSIKRNTKKGAAIQAGSDDYVIDYGNSKMELINIAPNEYREKYQSSFYRIRKVVGSNSEDFYWELTDKNGTRHYFGKQITSRYTLPTNVIVDWRLEFVTDVNNNVMSFTYFTDQNQLYLNKIQYTAVEGDSNKFAPYQVDFVLENWGCNTGPSSCIAVGAPIRYGLSPYGIVTAKRLKAIKISGRNASNGAQNLIRAYILSYVHDNNTNIDQLSSVQEYGKDAVIDAQGNITAGTALPVMSFKCYPTTGAPSSTVLNNNFQSHILPEGGDVNGDGQGDAVFGVPAPTGQQGWRICTGYSTGFTCQQPIYTDKPSYLADYTGDGLGDYLTRIQSNSYWTLCAYSFSSTNENWNCRTTNLSVGAAASPPKAVGDFDGDGYTDIIKPSPYGTCFSLGDAQFNCAGGSVGSANSIAVDLDGDGFDDVLTLGSTVSIYYSSGQRSTYGTVPLLSLKIALDPQFLEMLSAISMAMAYLTLPMFRPSG